MKDKNKPELDVLRTIIDGLTRLDDESRARVIRTVATFFDLDGRALGATEISSVSESANANSERPPAARFSGRPDMSPKEFLFVKSPRTDIERVACLGFYLTHYQALSEFGTAEISSLNLEGAQPRFANTAQAVKNATARGFLAQASGGRKQLSAFGEQYVQALPDRVAAQAVSDRVVPRKRRPTAKLKLRRRKK